MEFRLTGWRSLYEIDAPVDLRFTWDGLKGFLGVHSRVSRKDEVGGFGPYTLLPPAKPCSRHQDATERSTPHRCDSCVDRLTLAVFDADTGTLEAMPECDELLGLQGLARLWYSTHSHTPSHPAYRLVIPLGQGVHPQAWPEFRLALIRQFRIPADPNKCSGRSHFYYLPACRPHAEPPVALAKDGYFLDPSTVALTEKKPHVSFVSYGDLSGFTWEPPAETGEPVALAEVREKLQTKAKSLARKGETHKAELLRRMLRGEPLAQKGERNTATFQLSGMLPWHLPGLPLSTYQLLIRESVTAMQSAGSSITHEDVARMLLTAMRNKAEADYTQRKTDENIKRELEEFRKSIWRAAGLVGGDNGQTSGGTP